MLVREVRAVSILPPTAVPKGIQIKGGTTVAALERPTVLTWVAAGQSWEFVICFSVNEAT